MKITHTLDLTRLTEDWLIYSDDNQTFNIPRTAVGAAAPLQITVTAEAHKPKIKIKGKAKPRCGTEWIHAGELKTCDRELGHKGQHRSKPKEQ